MTGDTTNHPPELNISCSDTVATAAKDLSDIKTHVDMLLRSTFSRPIVWQIFPKWRINRAQRRPNEFAEQIFPFYRYARKENLLKPDGPHYMAFVPTNAVIGDSYRWLPDDINMEVQMQAISVAFDRFKISTPESLAPNCADYFYIRPLGILYAHEGKNRVALFKKHKLKHIPARVSDTDYPTPERLRIFEMPSACLAILDGRFIERVMTIEWIRDLMVAYGVQIEGSWPTDFPLLHDVLAALEKSDEEDYPAPVDLDQLKLVEACHNTEVRTPLLAIESVRLPSLRVFLWWAAALVLTLIGMVWAAGRSPVLHTTFAIAAGAIGILLVAPFKPILRCKVRNLKEPDRTEKFMELYRRRRRQAREKSD